MNQLGNMIQHAIEPHRLLLSWQRPIQGVESRPRRIVAELLRNGDEVVFRYRTDTPDFIKACEEGFKGFPAFKVERAEHRDGVIDAFIHRLPPRKREDFVNYLERYRLPADFAGSDFALLAYTGAKLPGDGFELIPDMTGVEPPLEIVIEVAGFRHREVPVSSIGLGDSVAFLSEPNNPVDPCAIAIHHKHGHIGYIPKPMCATMAEWIRINSVEAWVERLNGKIDRPLVYLFVKVRPGQSTPSRHEE